MTWPRWLFVITVTVSVFGARCTAVEQIADELNKFAAQSLEELNRSSFEIAPFKTATLDNVEQLKLADGQKCYVCWLKTDQGRAGYIALADVEGLYQILSISATTTNPGYLLKHLRLPKLKERPLRLSRTEQRSFVTDMPLVAATLTTLGQERIEVSEAACCLAGILGKLQHKEGAGLFGGLGMYGNQGFFWFLRQHSVDLSGENCTRIHEVLKKTVADNVEAGWQPFSQELDEALGGEKVPLRDSFERKLAFRLRARSLAVPILRRRLLNPLNMLERFELIEREEAQIVMHRDTSRGLKHARLLQEDYIGRDVGGLEKGIHTFFETRGMTAEVTFSRFKNLQPGHVPAILVGPDNAAGLLLGYIDVDGEQFALVFFPKTGSPSVMTLAEKARAIRKERGIPEPNEAEDTEFQESLQQVREAEARLRKIRQEKGLPDLPQEETAEERVWKAIDRMKKLEEELIVVEDRHSELPGSLEHGVHLVRCSGLASWGALYIGKLVAAENWGVLPWRELMHEL